MSLISDFWMTRFHLMIFFGWTVFSAADGMASKPPEYGVYGVQRIADKTAEVGDPISAASGAFSWSKVLIPLGGPMELDFSIHYRTDPNAAFARDPGDFPPGYPDFNTFLNAWSWQPAPLLLGNGFFDMTVLLEDGGQVCFQTNALGDFVFANLPEISAGVDQNYQLTRVESWFYFCDPERGRVTSFQPISFDANQLRPVTVEDRNGNRLTYAYEFPHYDSNPMSIADDEGRRLDFSYESYTTPSWGVRKRLATVSDHAGRTWTFLYETNAPDNNGRLTFRAVVGPDGKTNRFVYAPNDFVYEADNMASNLSLLAAVVEPLGNATFSNEYAATQLHPETPIHPRCVAQSDAYGNRLTLDMSYATGNFVGSVTNADGTSNRFVHHNHHDVPPASIQDEAGNTIGLTRNANAQIRSVTDRLGGTTAFGYDATGRRLESVTNAAGQVLRYAYQTATQLFHNATANHDVGFVFEQLTRIDYPDGTFEAFAYDGRGNVTARVDQVGARWTTEVDDRGRVRSTRNPTGGEVAYAYAPNGRLASLTNSDGFAQAYGYDATFRLVSITNADGTSQQFRYDVMDNVVEIVNELGQTNALAYDANGRLASGTDPSGNPVAYQYDRMNRATGVVDRAGGRATQTFDARGRPSVMRNPDGTEARLTYEMGNRPATLAIGGSVWSNRYDAEGVLVETRNPSGASSAYGSDALGNVTNATDALGRTAKVERDAMQRMVRATDPLNREIVRAYDAVGRMRSTHLPNGTFVSNAWNQAGHLVSLRDLNGQNWSFQRSALGRLEAVVDPLGRRRDHHYDARGNLVRTVFTAPGVALTNRFGRDAAGRLTNAVYGGATALSFERDACGRVASTVGVALQRDAVGRVTHTIRNGRTNATTYDAAGRIASVSYAGGAFRAEYAYNVTNGLLRRVSDTLTGASVEFAYDADFKSTRIVRGNGTVVTQQFDAVGQLVRLSDGAALDQRAAYDAAGQATQIMATLVIEPGSNLNASAQAFSYDAASQLSAPGYAYDALGRLTNSPDGAFEWDGASRLVATPAATYAYDGLGGLLSRTEGGQTVRYHVSYGLGASSILSEEQAATETDLRHYVWTPSGELLYLIDAAQGNALRYYHYDLSGNTIALSDAAGQITDAYAYDPYGRLLARTGESAQPFAFSGRRGVRRDGTNDLHQCGRRWFDARTAHFLSQEPLWPMVGDPSALNPYQYAYQSPVQFADANGLAPGSVMAWDQGSALMQEYDQLARAYDNAVNEYRMMKEEVDEAMRMLVIGHAIVTALEKNGGFDNWQAEMDPEDVAHMQAQNQHRRSLLNDLCRLEARRERIDRRAQAVVAFVAGNREALQKALHLARKKADHLEGKHKEFRQALMPAIRNNEANQAGLKANIWGQIQARLNRGDFAGARELNDDMDRQKAEMERENSELWGKIWKDENPLTDARHRAQQIERALRH